MCVYLSMYGHLANWKEKKKCNVLLCLEEDWYVSIMIIYNACLIISQRCKPLNSSWVVEMEKGIAFFI